MRVHLVDGTYELLRHYFAVPSAAATDGTEIAAARDATFSVLSMLEAGATHIGVATDHVIESFRNQLWPGYKSRRASNLSCSPSFRSSKTRSRRSASSSSP